MTVRELVKKLNLEIINEAESIDMEISGVYASDLLSLAMSNLLSGNAWITVQTNVNILGIAALTELSCIILAQNMNLQEDVVQKAQEENICVLRTPLTVYELCNRIGNTI